MSCSRWVDSTALVQEARAFFVSGSLSSGKQVVARERLGVAVPTRSIPLHC
jgi:hypothetical protein